MTKLSAMTEPFLFSLNCDPGYILKTVTFCPSSNDYQQSLYCLKTPQSNNTNNFLTLRPSISLHFDPHLLRPLHYNLIPHNIAFRFKPCICIEQNFIIFLFSDFFHSKKLENKFKKNYSHYSQYITHIQPFSRFTVRTPFYLILI